MYSKYITVDSYWETLVLRLCWQKLCRPVANCHTYWPSTVQKKMAICYVMFIWAS